ncbi:MAG: hypothetical protein MRZ12_07110 [Bacteroidales bacterium]|nr:hypothetical protein [Bacteroidales bacterium]
MKTKILYSIAIAAICAISCDNENSKPAPDMTVEFGESYCWIDLASTRTCSVPVSLTGTTFAFPLTLKVEAVASDDRSDASSYSLSADELVFNSAEDVVSLELTTAEGIESLNAEFVLSSVDEGVTIGENASVRIGAGDKFIGDFMATYTYVAADGTTETRTEEWSCNSETVTLPFPPFPSYVENSLTGILGVTADGGTVFSLKPTFIDGTDIEFTINLGCGDSGQYTCYNKTIDGTQYLASPIITDRNGKNVTSGTLKFASDGFKLTIPDYGEGQYLTYGLFEYGTKTFADKTDKGYISLADLSVVRK